jgi:hypothetical protein
MFPVYTSVAYTPIVCKSSKTFGMFWIQIVMCDQRKKECPKAGNGRAD